LLAAFADDAIASIVDERVREAVRTLVVHALPARGARA
jgi:hypothetical protein